MTKSYKYITISKEERVVLETIISIFQYKNPEYKRLSDTIYNLLKRSVPKKIQ